MWQHPESHRCGNALLSCGVLHVRLSLRKPYRQGPGKHGKASADADQQRVRQGTQLVRSRYLGGQRDTATQLSFSK
jgi:hypothetical protein